MFLEEDAKDLLIEIFKYNSSNSSGINYKKFRAQHKDQRDLLNYLEAHTYLKVTDNETYELSIFALGELENEYDEIGKVVNQFETVFQVFRSHYEKHQDKHLPIVELSDQTNVPEKEIIFLLTYLLDLRLWWSAHNLSTNKKDNFIEIAESILDYDSFRELFYQVINKKRESIKKEEKHNEPSWLTQTPIYKQELLTNFRPAISKPNWHDRLPNEINQLLDEVYFGLEKEMRVLPSIGLRTVIDLVCNEKIGDIGGFAKKLNHLVNKGFITKRNKQILDKALEVGHASAHRGYFPTIEKLRTVLEIVNHLLKEIYILEKASNEIKKDVPPRKK